jgi:ABC-type branched-subunit amino acid transport system substrate-binding protein
MNSRTLRRRTVAVTTIASAAVLGLAACGSGSGSSASGDLVVCEIAATSGPFTQLGQADERGADALAHMVNKQGGVLGHQIKLVKENDQSNPATAASLVRKCVTQDNANFIFGPEETSTATAAMPVADTLHTVLLGWQSGWTDIGLADAQLHSPYLFPGIGDVFHADDLDAVQKLVVPQHMSRVAVIEDNAPGGIGNAEYVQSLGSSRGFQMVAKQITTPGSTDDTPQALALLAAHPQIVILGEIPGSDSITAIKAIRAQDPNIPIAECSGCATPSFIAAAGGPTTMKNVYLLGAPQSLVDDVQQNAANKPAIDDTANYIKAMRAAGYTQPNFINNSSEGWDSGRALVAAIQAAKSTDTQAVSNALQHQKIVVGGVQAYYFARTPNNHGQITDTVSAMQIVGPDGSLQAFPAAQ